MARRLTKLLCYVVISATPACSCDDDSDSGTGAGGAAGAGAIGGTGGSTGGATAGGAGGATGGSAGASGNAGSGGGSGSAGGGTGGATGGTGGTGGATGGTGGATGGTGGATGGTGGATGGTGGTGPNACRGILFDGVSAIAKTGAADAYSPATSITAEAWVYPTASNAYGILVAHWGTTITSTGSWALFITSDKLEFAVSTAGNDVVKSSASTTLALNKWTHVAGVFNASTQSAQAFVDGVPTTATAVGAAKVHQPTNIPLTLGAYDYPTSTDLQAAFKGYIDEVRVSNVARYTAAFAPSAALVTDANTLALFHCDEASGTAAANSVAAGLGATLSSNAQFATATSCH